MSKGNEKYSLQIPISVDLELKLKTLAKEDERNLRTYCRRLLQSFVDDSDIDFENNNIYKQLKEEKIESEKQKLEEKQARKEKEKKVEDKVLEEPKKEEPKKEVAVVKETKEKEEVIEPKITKEITKPDEPKKVVRVAQLNNTNR